MGFDWHSACRDQWNKMSENWQANSTEMWEEGSRKDVIPVFTRYLTPEEGPILDTGCGDGYGSALLAGLGYEVVGVDLAERMIEKAKERENTKLHLSFLQGDIMNLPFAEHSFQGIMAINVVEWTASPHKTILKLKKYIKPGGILALGILGPTAAPRQHSYNRLYDKEVVCNTMMPWECGRLLTENGFEIIHQQGVYKRGVTDDMIGRLSLELCQSLSFLWMFYAKSMQ
ncbi:class I SAM-dependent methyltransferase [Aneurinibacillus terranovensis]|uniref:class I SAM-dependent methyltransferase n=1 Tax=Aneurinibacillus terranovensis TaxID=278991 RepID=UPI000413C65D|nr:class I SAM-dependent methyltransferase [Aneurinibacillus terranovensis]